jgi:hypothetical protein
MGPCHGDCHSANLIVAAGHDGLVHDVALIDLACFSEKAPFFYDTSYLELATLLRQMDGIGQERWWRLISVLAQPNELAASDLEHLERAWATDIFSGRKVVKELVEQAYGDRKDDLTLQMLLTQVAAGLTFINKRPRQQSGSVGLSEDQYLQAFVWAAIFLRRFFEVAQVKWLPSKEPVVPIGLQEREEPGVSTAEWRDLLHFDQTTFNILILSRLARASNEAAVRDLIRLPWNLILDLGTGSLSAEHARVRQRLVRQAWPSGPNPDLSTVARGTLWYFVNGRADIGEAPPATGIRQWRQKYLPSLQELLRSIVSRAAPKSVRSLVAGDDFPHDFFRLLLESIDNHFGEVAAPVLVATTSVQPLPDVPMSRAPLVSVLDALRATQGPAEHDLGDQVLLPHRTERRIELLQVAPEFIKRIEKDLTVVYRGLAHWFPPDRLFGVDFRRGHLIEWSELDNDIDVKRQMLRPLLNKLRAELSKSTNSTVNLLHEPSAGGTTVGRRVAWELMEEHPVALLSQISDSTAEYIGELFQECGLPVLVIMEAEVVTESARELLFRELLDDNTRAVFLWVSRIYGDVMSPDVLGAALGDGEAEEFQGAYEGVALPGRREALAHLTSDPELREQRTPFFYGLTAFEDRYLGLDKLVGEITTPLDSGGRDLIGDLALVSLYSGGGFPAPEFDELCHLFHHGEWPFPTTSPFAVSLGQQIKISHRLIATRVLQTLARVPVQWKADLGRFALGLLQRLRRVTGHDADRLRDMVTTLFVARDITALLSADADVLAGGVPRQSRFAPLIHDLGSVEVGRAVLKALFNDWPREPHFAVHYARHLLYEEPREVDQAMRVVELAYRGPGRDDDAVVHTLGMCYRVRTEWTLRRAREQKLRFSDVEDQVQSDSRNALEHFTDASRLNPVSEYGHISTIQTVSSLLRGAVQLSATDLAGLLKDPRSIWLVPALARAEDGITALQTRPRTHLSVRAQRTIAEWALVYGQVEKVIQQLRTLSDRYEDPGVRRALCGAILMKHNRRWRSVPDGELRTITLLMERNIESSEFTDSDLSRWLRAYRLGGGFQIERAIERLIDWHRLRPDAVEPVYYLYIFYFVRWLNSERTNRGYIDAAQRWLELCRRSRALGQRRWSYEWLVAHDGRFDALGFNDLDFDPVQTVIGRTPKDLEKLRDLPRIEGTLSRYMGPQRALVDLGQGFSIHITPRTEIVREHEGMRVNALVSFSYDGPVGWDPQLARG